MGCHIAAGVIRSLMCLGAIRAHLEEQTILDEFAAGREIAREDPGAWVLSSA